jgi:hypothetical protein
MGECPAPAPPRSVRPPVPRWRLRTARAASVWRHGQHRQDRQDRRTAEKADN